MIKICVIETPEQLRELYAIQPDGNRSMENLERFWRAQRVLASSHYANTMPVNFARVYFDTIARTATVIKAIGGNTDPIGRLPYNKALAYCRERFTFIQPTLQGFDTGGL
ncbi:MAG: hypothetical protein RR521_11315 [Clostridia bacterium]